MDGRMASPSAAGDEEERLQTSLRPRGLDEFIGQDLQRREVLDHLLPAGQLGLGKTTLAHITANEMHGKLVTTSGPALERAYDLMGMLTRLYAGDVFFIVHIYRLPRVVEEYIYQAME